MMMKTKIGKKTLDLVGVGQKGSIFWAPNSALDPATGQILWQTAHPDPFQTARDAVTSANGIFVCLQHATGHKHALNSADGSILWRFASGGPCNAGADGTDGEVY